jgi:hypothetical protein
MRLKNLPANFNQWELSRKEHLNRNLIKSTFTTDLYSQYKKHLATPRYSILLQVQLVLIPEKVRRLLDLGNTTWITPILYIYKLIRGLKLEKPFKNSLLPNSYKSQINGFDNYENER